MWNRQVFASFSIIFFASASTVRADLVTNSNMTLTAPSATENRLALSVDFGGPPAFSTTDISGTVNVTLVFDNSNNVTGIAFNGGTIAGTDFAFDLGLLGIVNGTNLVATVNTFGGTQPVTGGQFDATQHTLTIVTGIVSGVGGLGSVDLSLIQPSGTGTGMGTVSLTPTGNPSIFNTRVELPFSIDETIPIGIASANLGIDGKLVAAGVAVVPEPSAVMLLSVVSVGCTVVSWWRYRRQGSSILGAFRENHPSDRHSRRVIRRCQTVVTESR